MLRPKDLTPSQYPMALKPSLGYERQLHVSLEQFVEPGSFDVVAVNSGVWTPNTADGLALADAPQELLVCVDDGCDAGQVDVVVTVTGQDQNSAALTGTATIKVPAYAAMADRVFPRWYGAEVIPTADGRKFKSITGVAVVCSATMAGTKLRVFGVPSLATYKLLSGKTQMDYNSKVPMPVSVQIGRDKSRFVKSGEIPEGSMNVTSKEPTVVDGLSRVNGRRVTGLLKEVKEDKLPTMHTFLLGLILTANPTVPESAEPVTLSATAIYEAMVMVVAQ